MTVLQLCLAYPPNLNGGGACLVAGELTAEMARDGHALLVIAPKHDGAHFSRPLSRTEQVQGDHCQVTFLGSWVRWGFNTFNPAALALVPPSIDVADVTVIHGIRTFIGTVGGLYCRIARKPYIVFPHGMTVRRWRSMFIKLVYDKLIGDSLLRGAAAILCSTERERQEIISTIRCGPEHVRVVSVCTWRDTFRPKDPHWVKARLAFLGRVVREKSIDLVMQALASSPVGKQFRFEIYGPAEDEVYLAELKATAARHALDVAFGGPIYGEAKDAMLASCHLLTLVSEYESYGLVAQEAIQAGTPVLVTTTCGIAHGLSDQVGIVAERSVESIRGELESLAEQGFHKLRALIETCRQSVGASRFTSMSEAISSTVHRDA